MFMVLNGHQGGFHSIFLDFLKNSNFELFCLIYVNNCPKFEISTKSDLLMVWSRKDLSPKMGSLRSLLIGVPKFLTKFAFY